MVKYYEGTNMDIGTDCVEFNPCDKVIYPYYPGFALSVFSGNFYMKCYGR